ncbi:hypothetical protein F3J34_07935 [Klebsiella sp. Ap-873]|nr:hypothetical protein [Klebsiella sp. Ap-873]
MEDVMANEGIKSAFNTIGFQTYQPDPEDLCSLCGGNHGKDSMIGCRDKIHVCMECVDLLAQIKQEKAARKRDEAIEGLLSVMDYRSGCSAKPLSGWIYDAIAAGKIPGIRIE